MATLKGKTLFITGASRGIGKAIALRAAAEGANVVLAAKTSDVHPKLPGTIHSAAREVEEAGGKALPLRIDIRFEEQTAAGAAKAAEMFGVNVRGTFAASQAVLPYLLKGSNPHILNLSPPLSLDPKWFRNHCAYTMAKYGMSLCVLGMAEEFREAGVAVNALWPKTVIATAAISMLGGVEERNCRKPEIVADAARAILARDSRSCTGNFFLDEEVLAAEGVTDLSRYAVDPGSPLLPDLFLDGPG